MNKIYLDLQKRVEEYEQLLEHARLMQMDEGTLYCLEQDIEEWKALAANYAKAIDCMCDGKNKKCNLCDGLGVISSEVINIGKSK